MDLREHELQAADGRSHRSVGEDDSGADLSERIGRELEEIGLTEMAPWVSSLVLFGTGGLAVLGAELFVPDKISPLVDLLATIALVMAAFSLWAIKNRRFVGWATPVRVFTGIGIIFIGGLTDPALAGTFTMILMFPMISPAYLYAARRSVPFMIVGTTALVVMVAIGHDRPWSTAQALVAGTVVATLVSSVIVSQSRLRMLIRLHYERSITDPLTGLANTRRLKRELERRSAAAESGTGFALFAIDLDNFKQVNDRFDHRKGDAVLAAVGEALRSQAEPGDLVARRGGDEFSVLVPADDGRDLDDFAERLRRAIVVARKRTCPHVTPSGSIGYALAQAGDSPEAAIARADAALHESKQQFHDGRAGRRAPVVQSVTDIARKRAGAGPVESAPAKTSKGFLRAIGQRWFIVASISFELAVMLPIVSLIADTGELSLVEALAFSVGFLTLAVASWATGQLGIWATHISFLLLGGLIAAAVLSAGPAGAAFVDLFLLSGLISFFIFTPRVAAFWFVAMLAAMSTIALTEHFPNAGARMGMTVAVSAVLATMFAKIRKLTVKYMEHHAEMAQIDPLTGLANRRLLHDRVSESLEEASGQDASVAMLAIDLDDFKLVNDTISHSFGDQVLCDVAEAIRSTTRPEDLVARRGGDEFYVVCCQSSADAIDSIAQRVGEAIARARLDACPNINPSATVVTIESEPGDTADDLLYRADVALHAGKVRSHTERERSHLRSA
ncbi:MAG: diguanylate cyclase [Actinobacteria bacterium]|nr:diguanylate cyclase [Actinomycetota bacterium]